MRKLMFGDGRKIPQGSPASKSQNPIPGLCCSKAQVSEPVATWCSKAGGFPETVSQDGQTLPRSKFLTLLNPISQPKSKSNFFRKTIPKLDTKVRMAGHHKQDFRRVGVVDYLFYVFRIWLDQLLRLAGCHNLQIFLYHRLIIWY